jgi:hypothetical protein
MEERAPLTAYISLPAARRRGTDLRTTAASRSAAQPCRHPSRPSWNRGQSQTSLTSSPVTRSATWKGSASSWTSKRRQPRRSVRAQTAPRRRSRTPRARANDENGRGREAREIETGPRPRSGESRNARDMARLFATRVPSTAAWNRPTLRERPDGLGRPARGLGPGMSRSSRPSEMVNLRDGQPPRWSTSEMVNLRDGHGPVRSRADRAQTRTGPRPSWTMTTLDHDHPGP